MTNRGECSKYKRSVEELACFGGNKIFGIPKSTSNLLKPDFKKFLGYSKTFHDAKRYTNNGPIVQLLEKRLAEYHEVAFCITFSSGFWALAITISALALKGKTEVIVPSLTYRRMADIISWTGLKPHFCDVDEETMSMGMDSISRSINDKTAIILAAHPIVNCCDAKNISELAESKGIPLIFDSVESVHETVSGKRVGGYGDAEGFSLHACKLINGGGGGYITTNNKVLARELRSLRSFGYEGYDHVEYGHGLNSKLNEMHAAMALSSLDDIETQVQRNKKIYLHYKNKLTDFEAIRLVKFNEEELSGYKNIVIELMPSWPLSRALTIKILNQENILARVYYSPALHHVKRSFDSVAGCLSVTDKVSENFVNLPCGQQVSEGDIDLIISLLHFIFEHAEHIAEREDNVFAE